MAGVRRYEIRRENVTVHQLDLIGDMHEVTVCGWVVYGEPLGYGNQWRRLAERVERRAAEELVARWQENQRATLG